MRPFLLSLSCLYTVKTTAYGSIYTFSSLLNLLFFVQHVKDRVIYDWKIYNLQVKLQTKNQDRSGE